MRVGRATVLAALAVTVLVTGSAPAGADDPVAGATPVVPAGTAGGPAPGGTVLAAPPPAGTTMVVPAGMAGPTEIAVTTSLEPGSAAQVAIDFALAQIGLPYLWGGNGPQAGDAGFDCSGLTTAAYAAAGIGLPRTAQTQYNRGPHVAPGSPLLPGDLVFYGVPSKVHHVGLYLGGGRMVNAPRFGKPVQIAPHRWTGDDYLGATRPAAGGSGTVLPFSGGPGGGTLITAPPPLVALLLPPAPDAVPPPTVIDLGPPSGSEPPVLNDPPAGAPQLPDPPPADPPGGGTVIDAPPPLAGGPPTPQPPVSTPSNPAVPPPATGPVTPGTPVPPTGPPSGDPDPPVTSGPGTPTPTDPGTPTPTPTPIPTPIPTPTPTPTTPTPEPTPEPEPVLTPPVSVASGGEIVDVVDARPGLQGRLILEVGAFTTWPAVGDIVLLVAADGTERRATMVEADPATGRLLVDPIT